MSSPRITQDLLYTPRMNNFRIPASASKAQMEIRYTENGKIMFVGSETSKVPAPPNRERRMIRFMGPGRRPVRPVLSRDPLMSASDLGFAPPNLSTPRRRPMTDRHEEERRRRLIEASYFERESFVSRETSDDFGQDKSSRLTNNAICPHCGSDRRQHASTSLPSVQYIVTEDDKATTRSSETKKAVRSANRMDDVRVSAAHAIPANESSDEGVMQELAELQNKLEPWYQGILEADEDFRSDVLYLEMKMQELLGPSWPARQSEPDIIRASVCCDMLGRLISSTPAISRLGTALLEELIAGIFQQKGKAVPSGENSRAQDEEHDHGAGLLPRGLSFLELGEPYFATVRKLQAQVSELQEIVGKLRKEHISQEEEKMSKVGNLLGRIVGRLGEQTFRMWKRRAQRNNMWKQHNKQLNRKQGARWLPRIFFKWLAATEEGKRARWQRVAEMLKWERDYGMHARQDGLESPSSEGSRRSGGLGASGLLGVPAGFGPLSGAGARPGEMLRSASGSSAGSAALGGERGRLLWGSASGGRGEVDDVSFRTTAPWSGGERRPSMRSDAPLDEGEAQAAEGGVQAEGGREGEEVEQGGDVVPPLQPFSPAGPG